MSLTRAKMTSLKDKLLAKERALEGATLKSRPSKPKPTKPKAKAKN